MKLFKATRPDGYKYGPAYQSEPKCNSGTGRFQVYHTDNANARAIGRRPKWTAVDLYTMKRELCDTLAEASEWCEKQEKRT